MRVLLTGMMFLLAGFMSPALSAATTGEAAPNFTATDALSGNAITLQDLKGKIVVLEWANYGCPFVKKHYSVSNIQHMQQRAEKDGIVWITINSGAQGKQGYFESDALAAKAVADQKASPSYYVRDVSGEVGKLYGAKTTPHFFVINDEGVLVYQGAIDDKPSVASADIPTSKNYVSAVLAQLKQGKAVTVKDTKPYGCSVKYDLF